MRFWTHYWKAETVAQSEVSVEGAEIPVALNHTAGNQFRQRGIAVGDDVYVVSYSKGTLRVVGRLTVGAVVDRAEARRRLLYEPWEAADHLLAATGSATARRFDAVVPAQELFDIEFLDAQGKVVPPKRSRRGVPDQQTFRGVREITERTARLFDSVLTALD